MRQTVVPLQLFAYYFGVPLGRHGGIIDQGERWGRQPAGFTRRPKQQVCIDQQLHSPSPKSFSISALPIESDMNCSVDLRSTTAVGDRRLEFVHFQYA
jgi:hypothetical protein